MFRTILLASIAALGLSRAHAQVRFDIGMAFAASSKLVDTYASDPSVSNPGPIPVTRSGGIGAGLFVYPKYHFLSLPAVSLSVGAPVMLGIGSRSRSIGDLDDIGGNTFAYDGSLAVDFNVGIPAPKKMDSRLGAYVGAGVGVQRTGLRLEDRPFNDGNVPANQLNEDVRTVGYVIHAGLMVRTPSKPIGIGVATKRPFADGQLTFTTVRLFIPI